MNQSHRKEVRMLAIDPSPRGFGFAVLEGANRLVDWGVKSARRDKNRACLRKVAELIEIYRPDVVVVEECDVAGSRRCSRVRRLIAAMAEFAAKRKMRVRRFTRRQVQAKFSEPGGGTKHGIAVAITRGFPELAPSLPPARKPWMSEDCRMQIFDAVGLGCLQNKNLNG